MCSMHFNRSISMQNTYRKGAPQRIIKLPTFDSPDQVISKSAAKPTDTELEVAALTIQLYCSRSQPCAVVR